MRERVEESGVLSILIYGLDFRRLCLSDKVVHADAVAAPTDIPLLLHPLPRAFLQPVILSPIRASWRTITRTWFAGLVLRET